VAWPGAGSPARLAAALPAYAIGGIASFWLIERVLAFGGG